MSNRNKIYRSDHCPAFREKQGEIHALAQRHAWPWALKKDV